MSFLLSETVDFLSPESMQVFKTWTGELRYLPNIKLRKYTKKGLEAMISGTHDPEDQQANSDQMEEDCVTSEDEDQSGEEVME